MSVPVAATGGVGGIDAQGRDILATAGLFGTAAEACTHDTVTLGLHLADPALTASAVFDPPGYAAAQGELALAAARVGALASRCSGLDVALRAAVVAYDAADVLCDLGTAYLVPSVLLPTAVARGGATALRTGNLGAGLQRGLTTDPGLADVIVSAVPGEVGGVTGLLSVAYADGAPVVDSLGATTAPPPRSLAGLMSGLAARNDGAPGEIDVRMLAGAGGRRRAVVDIPGTKDWSMALRQGDVTSLATNLRAVSGRETTYEAGVVAAIQAAGVRPDDDVLLVGHSEGGMVALNIAEHSSGLHISHVITAGAPIGLIAGSAPSSVDVMALENSGDVVPHLDGNSNPDRPNVLTVRVSHDTGTVIGNHGLWQSYVPGAADVDASGDPAVRAYLDGLTGFLDADSDETHRYVITRTYR